MAWAGFDGGEMLLVTESGEIGKSLERYLKILATESTYRGRGIGQNYADINLTGVLSIDSNEKVLFSSEMNSRAVNIAFKNRPKGETDSERESIFAPYWEAFTEQRVSETSREATALAGVLLYTLHLFIGDKINLSSILSKWRWITSAVITLILMTCKFILLRSISKVTRQ